MRSLTAQLLAVDTPLAVYILEDFANNGLRPNKKSLGVILEKLIAALPFVRLVVDGLDECLESDHREVIEDLLKVRGPKPGVCKILLSSRRMQSISRLLQNKTTIQLDSCTRHIDNNISIFVDRKLTGLRQTFPSSLLDELQQLITKKAHGSLDSDSRAALLTIPT